MSSDSEPPPSGQTHAAATNAGVDIDMDSSNVPHNSVEVPSTPLGAALGATESVIPASQDTILSTEGPGSPMDADESFRTELNDNDDEDIDVEVETVPRPQNTIPSSLTPPPSSQHRFQPPQQRHPLPLQQPQSHISATASASSTTAVNGNSNSLHVPSAVSQRSAIPSPPGTGLSSVAQARRDAAAAAALGLGPAASNAAAVVAAAAAAAANGNGSPLLGGATDFVPPTPAQIVDASPDELRALLQASLAEHTRLKTETAHHKLQYNLLTLQADEDAKRAAVEHEMTRREVEALRAADSARQARRDLTTSSATETSEAKYRQLKAWYDEAVEENDSLQKRVKLAKRVIQQKEEEMAGLVDEKELLLNRLRENREHFHLLCSPGGLFHGAMTPKPQGSPVHTRATPYQTPKRATTKAAPAASNNNTASHANHASAEPFAALLQALNQENNSAPNTPLTGHRPPPRHIAKHVRNVQSLSSLPTTPTSRPRGGEYGGGLLPSVDLVPQTEPPPRFGGPSGHGHGHSHSVSHSHSQSFTTSASGRYFPETPTRPRHRLPGHQGATTANPAGGRRSRESTISVDEDSHNSQSHSQQGQGGSIGRALTGNEDIARQALESVARSTTQSFPPPSFGNSRSSRPLDRSTSSSSGTAADEHVFESQASQAASAMLRRDARESFEVAAQREASRERERERDSSSGKMQAKLFGGVNKAGNGGGAGAGAGSVDKRKFSGGQPMHGSDQHHTDPHNSHLQASPTKKVRIVPSLRDNNDSYRHHHTHGYNQPAAQDPDRVGLGIRYD